MKPLFEEAPDGRVEPTFRHLEQWDSGPATLPSALVQPYQLRIEFTGSGSEYFRIWVVNLLLLIVTVGIYYPWAKVRRLRYFHGNTLVDGEPMGFHGKPLKMLKGYFLVGLLFALYSVAGNFSPVAGLVAFVIVTAIWPALLKSSMQFRLANTSWRGMRFRFSGSMGGAYRSVIPMFVPSLIILVAIVFVVDPQKPPVWYLKVVGVVTLLGLALVPWLMYNLKRYQHDNYGLATLRTSFRASVNSFYEVFGKLFGVTILPTILSLTIAGAAVAVGFAARKSGALTPSNMKFFIGLGIALFVVSFMATFVVIKPWFTTRLQNLIWSGTHNHALRFFSDLRFKSMLWLTVKNWLLIVLTLGLYWPFAAIAMARMRLHAVRLELQQSPDELLNLAHSAEGEAAGDAAGDLFGLDIGF